MKKYGRRIKYGQRGKITGQRVRVIDGMLEFIGKEGTIIDIEKYGSGSPRIMYRVRFDEPVEVKGVGQVWDDVWAGSFLKTVKMHKEE